MSIFVKFAGVCPTKDCLEIAGKLLNMKVMFYSSVQSYYNRQKLIEGLKYTNYNTKIRTGNQKISTTSTHHLISRL